MKKVDDDFDQKMYLLPFTISSKNIVQNPMLDGQLMLIVIRYIIYLYVVLQNGDCYDTKI